MSAEAIYLKTSDNNIIETNQNVIRCSRLLTSMIQLSSTSEATEPIHLDKISTPILNKVLEWGSHHKDDAITENDIDLPDFQNDIHLDPWDQEFLNVDQTTLFNIITV
ncbi:hypothetical protein HZS_2955 [Henneguya salminicola]|nr:hypothetical protein HZS_2955 [Henneguya salminicola]